MTPRSIQFIHAVIVSAAITFVASLSALAQDDIPELAALRTRLVGNAFYIRGHNTNTKIDWKMQNGVLVTADTKYHMVSALQVSAVKLHKNHLYLEGSLLAIEKTKTAYGISPVKQSAQMDIDLTGADIPLILPKIPAMIFYRTKEEAVAGTPVQVDPASKAATDASSSPCQCSDTAGSLCHLGSGVTNGTISEPKLIHYAEPEFTDEARLHRFSGSSEIYLIIGKDGHVGNLWIVYPLPYGLDKMAADAVSKYVFKPATCNGIPVMVDMYVDVNFQSN